MPITVAVADDHTMIREGLENLLKSQDDMSVVWQAADGRSAVRMAEQSPIDVLIMDIAMPGLNGIAATREILARNCNVKVIALSMHSDRQYVTAMFRAGARGYLVKESAFDELTRAIRAIHSGRTYLSPQISDSVVGVLAEKAAAGIGEASPELSSRQQQVLQLLAEGKTTREIASELCLSIKTVETHRSQIMARLHIHSIAELTKYAVRQGITRLEA